MSRLEQHQQKQFITRIIFGVLIFITLAVLIFTLGLRFLLNASSFIARLSEDNTSTNTLKKNQNFIGDVDIDTIPTATNSARINVGGSVVNFNKVEFYLNGDLVKETALSSSDNFSEEIGELQNGENEIYVIAKSTDQDEEKKSSTFTVVYKGEKPKLELNEPQDGLKTNQQEVKLAGATDKETYIKVNDLPVVVDAQGNFQTFVRLKEGENQIKITAMDFAGNNEEKTLTVSYQKD